MKFTNKLILLLLILATGAVSYGQNVGINTETPDNSAALEIFSTNRGVLVPRLNSTQRSSIGTPAEGLFLFDTDSSTFMYYASGQWHQIIGDVKTEWINTGADLYSGSPGNVGIGTTTPQSTLHINDTITGAPKLQISNDSHNYIVGIDETEGVLQIGNLPSFGGASIFIDDSGRVGIGSNTPQGNLDIHNEAGNLEINWSTPGRRIIVGIDETEGVLNLGHAPTAYTDGIHLSIDTVGRIGIGTSAPESMLHLESDSSSAEIHFSDNNTTRDFSIGIEADSGAFVIAVDSLGTGVRKPIFSVSDAGALYLDAPGENQVVKINDKLVAESIQLSGTYSSGDVLTVDAAGNLIYMSELRTPIIDLYNTDTFDLAITWTDMTWDGLRIVDADYTMLSANQVIRVETSGTYRVDFTMGASVESSGNEVQLLGHLMMDTGTGYGIIPGSSLMSWFNHNYAMNTASRTIYLDLDTGDLLKMQVMKTDNKLLVKKSGAFGFSMQRVHR